jgi:hypothetical protein
VNSLERVTSDLLVNHHHRKDAHHSIRGGCSQSFTITHCAKMATAMGLSKLSQSGEHPPTITSQIYVDTGDIG